MNAQAAAWRSTPDGFDFTRHVRRLCVDMTTRAPELRHIQMDRVAIRYCQTRSSASHGLQASLTPLRFEGGARSAHRGGQAWIVEPIVDGEGREMLYLLSFYLPRFLNLPRREKLVTVLHELWHISPNFDGDIRRLPGRCYVHSHSERQYDAAMQALAERWLAMNPPAKLHNFLKYNFRQLLARHGAVHGLRLPTPKIVPARPDVA